jgi:hypothetical protein
MEISTLPAGFRELLTVPTGHSHCFIDFAFKTEVLNQFSFSILKDLASNLIHVAHGVHVGSCCAQKSLSILDEKA